MKRGEEKKKASRQKPAAPARRLFSRKTVEASGGANLKGRSVTVSGDVVGRDKLAAGDDILEVTGSGNIVAGDDVVQVQPGAIHVSEGGRLIRVDLPRSARLAVIAGAAALIVIALGVILPVGEAVADGGFESGQSGNRSGKWELSAGVRIVESDEEDTPDNGKWKASVPVGEAMTQREVEIPPGPSEMSVWYRSQNGSSRGTLQVRFDNGIVYSQGVAAELEWEQSKFPINHEKYGGRTVSLTVEYFASAGRAGGLLLIAAQPDVNAIWVDNIQISEIDAETVAQVTVAPTATATATPTRTPAPTFTPTPTPAPTETPLLAAILTDTPSPTHTSTRARTRTPTATWTLSPTPTPAAAIDFSADRTAVTAGECVTLRWAVENVREVYLYGGEFGSLPGVGVAGRDSRRACPPVTAAYTLRIIKRDGSEVNRTVTISVTAAPTPTSTATPTPAPPPPVVNGSFEQPPVPSGSTTWFSSIPGWSLSFGPAIEVSNNVPAYGLTAADGAQLVELDSYAPSGIFQDLPTAPGARYTLIFTFGARPGYGPDDNALEVWWDGSPLATLTLDGTGASTPVWQDYSYIVTATGSTTRLEFRDVGTPSTQGTLLDNVRMASAP